MPGTKAPSREVNRLIDRIRRLVAEQRRLEGTSSNQRLAANRREVARLQLRLANVVKRELAQ